MAGLYPDVQSLHSRIPSIPKYYGKLARLLNGTLIAPLHFQSTNESHD
jgi:hypothetical protein